MLCFALVAGLVAGCTAPTSTSTTTAPHGTGSGPIQENFDTTPVGRLPSGWVSASGTWGVVRNSTAPSPPNAMQQSQALPNYFNVLVDKADATYADFQASVKLNIQPGPAEMTGGLAFRYVDQNNHYAVDYDNHEGTWSLYKFINGQQEKVVSSVNNVPNATTGQWLDLTVKAVGSHIQAFYAGTKIIDFTEYEPGAPTVGYFGLWSKDESVVLYDDFHADSQVTL